MKQINKWTFTQFQFSFILKRQELHLKQINRKVLLCTNHTHVQGSRSLATDNNDTKKARSTNKTVTATASATWRCPCATGWYCNIYLKVQLVHVFEKYSVSGRFLVCTVKCEKFTQSLFHPLVEAFLPSSKIDTICSIKECIFALVLNLSHHVSR